MKWNLTESELDNALVMQKDRIINYINRGQLEQASAALDVVSALWESVSYGYKVKELQERINDAMMHAARFEAVSKRRAGRPGNFFS